MITPTFTVTQTETMVRLSIHLPLVKAKEMDISFTPSSVTLTAAPYFLRVHLPKEIAADVADEEGRATLDHTSDTLCLTLPKAVPGEFFPDLDMLSVLLKPPRDAALIPMISVLGASDIRPSERLDGEIDFSWHQEAPAVFDEGTGYGFLKRYRGVFQPYAQELAEIVDNPQPGVLTGTALRDARLLREEDDFDPEHVAADVVDAALVDECLAFRPVSVGLEERHRNEMVELARRDVQTTDPVKAKVLLLGLVDLLFAYAYDVRTTQGEPTVESGWTMSKLSAQLSWLDEFHTLSSVLQSVMRRSLTYPLHRHWALSWAVVQDVVAILQQGRTAVLRALLDIRHTLQRSDLRRLLAHVYLDDYCLWIQTVDEATLAALTRQMVRVQPPSKHTLFACMDVDEIEQYARQHADMMDQLD